YVARFRKESGRGAQPAVPATARSSWPGALHHSFLRFTSIGAHGSRRRPPLCGNCFVIGPRRPHAIAHFCPARVVAGGHPGEPEVSSDDRAVWCRVHAWTRTTRHALSSLCLPADRPG